MKQLFKKFILLMIVTSTLQILSSSAWAAEPGATANTCSCPNPNVPLNQANLSETSLLVWANTATVTAFTYNFVNYKTELQSISAYFTPEGWNAFKDALDNSGNLNAVIKNKLVVTAVAQGAPLILQEGIMNGVYTWKVQMPVLIEYKGALGSNVQHSIVTMLIARVKSTAPQNGIGIKQFDVTNAPTPNAKHEVIR